MRPVSVALGALAVAALTVAPPVTAQTVEKLRISADVAESAWITLYADVDVKWSDGSVRRLSYPLATGSVSTLPTETFDFADGTRQLTDINGIWLRAEPATGTPYGTVYWDCLELENVRVRYRLATETQFKSIDINTPEPLVPAPDADKTKCPGLRIVRIY